MRFPFRPRRRVSLADVAGAPRKTKKRLVIPPCPTSRLEVDGGIARFTIERELLTPNKTLWSSPWVKKADRDSWGTAIFNAIVIYLEGQGIELSVLDRQVIANRPMPVTLPSGRTVMRRRHRAPQMRYTMCVIREVPRKACFMADDRNLSSSVKHLEDALVAHCVIYDDRREYLTAPLPIQRVSEDGVYRTIVEVTPWAQPRLSGESNAARN